MKNYLFLALASIFALTGCASPEQASQNRETHMARLLPNPADREGIFLIFPASDKLIIKYFPNVVSESQILRRVAPICQSMGRQPVRGSDPTTATEATLADGSTVAASSFVVNCVSA